MADLADIAAATTAGYAEIVLDRGSGVSTAARFEVTLETRAGIEPATLGLKGA
jgi:hypothetical protein